MTKLRNMLSQLRFQKTVIEKSLIPEETEMGQEETL